MKNCRQVIKELGGTRKVADALNVVQRTVQYWWERDSIPAPHWNKLVSFAKEQKVDLTLQHLADIAERASAE